MPHYVPIREASKLLGISKISLRKYADEGKIPTIRTPANQRRFDVESYLKQQSGTRVVCYARVSSAKQRDDLDRQVDSLSKIFSDAEVIKDVASGLSFKRKGLQTLLEYLLRGDKLKVVVTHKDRLARFGTELIKFIIEKNGGELLVLEEDLADPNTELTTDLLAILDKFSREMHGRRNHSKVKEDFAKTNVEAENPIGPVLRSFEIQLQQGSGADSEEIGGGED